METRWIDRPLPKWTCLAMVVTTTAGIVGLVAMLATRPQATQRQVVMEKACCCVVGNSDTRHDGGWCDPADCPKHGEWWDEMEQQQAGEEPFFQPDPPPAVRSSHDDV